jgi:hypothetical protein
MAPDSMAGRRTGLQTAAGREVYTDAAKGFADALTNIDKVEQIEPVRVRLVGEQVDVGGDGRFATGGGAKQVESGNPGRAKLRLTRA